MNDKEKKFSGILGLCIRAGKAVQGSEACLAELKKGRLNLLVMDSEISLQTVKKFSDKCTYYKTEFIRWDGTGLSALLNNSKKIYGIKDSGFANELKKIFNL